VALLLVALVAAAGFAVIAQRRLRQIGMLATIGATGKQIRLVLLGQGALTGLLGAAAGAAAGLAVWLPLATHLESAAGHRIDRFALPWPMLALLVAVGVFSATAAAWWPGRAVARIPAVQALSARPPRPVRARQSVGAAVLLTVAGAACLIASHRTSGLLVCLGIVGIVGGILLLSPVVVRVLAGSARRMPFTTRLVLRDLGRHQARSGAALAAITLAIGLPVAISVLAAVNQHNSATGNLSARDLLVRTSRDIAVVPVLPADRTRQQLAAVRKFAGSLGGTATPLLMAYDPAIRRSRGTDGSNGQPVLEADRPAGANRFASGTLYVATPDAVRRFGLDPARAAGADILNQASGQGQLTLIGAASREVSTRTAYVPGGSAYSARPHIFVTPESVRAHGWRTLTEGWFVSAPHDLTAAQRGAARDVAAANGLTTEVRDRQDGLRTVRWASVAGGTVLALAVLAMTVGTLRAESADDLRTLVATGAGSRTRRALTAATAGSLALAGTVLGTLGAYAVLLCAYRDDLAPLRHIPYAALVIAFPGLPLAATATAWLSATREPSTVSRRLLE